MGNQSVTKIDKDSRAKFIKHLLGDIRALEIMLANNAIESDTIRIGAEQEFCLVNNDWRPADNATRILRAIDDPHFTNEIARYNLEINLDPEILTGDCFSKVEQQLRHLLNKARDAAKKHDTNVLRPAFYPLSA